MKRPRRPAFTLFAALALLAAAAVFPGRPTQPSASQAEAMSDGGGCAGTPAWPVRSWRPACHRECLARSLRGPVRPARPGIGPGTVPKARRRRRRLSRPCSQRRRHWRRLRRLPSRGRLFRWQRRLVRRRRRDWRHRRYWQASGWPAAPATGSATGPRAWRPWGVLGVSGSWYGPSCGDRFAGAWCAGRAATRALVWPIPSRCQCGDGADTCARRHLLSVGQAGFGT